MSFSFGNFVQTDPNPAVHFNTGTMLDMITGKFLQGHDGKYYLNGGIGNFFYLTMGKPSRFKTTLTNYFFAKYIAYHYAAELLCIDTEDTNIDKTRFQRMVQDTGTDITSRVIIPPKMRINQVMRTLIDVSKDRRANAKSLTVETPFVNKDGKRIRSMTPAAIILDSISYLEDDNTEDLLDKHALESEKMNMIWMNKGKRKTILSEATKAMVGEAGIACCWVSHLGEATDMGATPRAKDQQFMKQKDKIKGAGSNTAFGATVQLEARNSNIYEQDKGDPKYRTFIKNSVDLNKVQMLVHKGKNNMAGTTFDFVVSQNNGVYEHLSNVDYLKAKPSFGLHASSNNVNFSTVFTPTQKNNRNTIFFSLEEDARLRRAYQVLAHMKYLFENMDVRSLPVDVQAYDINRVAELLLEKDTAMVDTILNSQSVWCEDTGVPHLSIVDILLLLEKYRVLPTAK